MTTQFLPAHIDLFESQVDSYASVASEHAAPILASDVEELMSIYVSLLQELDKKASRALPPGTQDFSAIGQWVPHYQQHARLGAKIVALIRQLKGLGVNVAGLDAFMRALIATRASADAEEVNAAFLAIGNGTLKTRPLVESAHELSD